MSTFEEVIGKEDGGFYHKYHYTFKSGKMMKSNKEFSVGDKIKVEECEVY